MAMEFLTTIEEIRKVCLQPQYISYCALWSRPGLLHWMVEVEYTRFKPDTDANDDFHLSIMRWPDDSPGLIYSIVTFHEKEKEWAESRLWENGLRKVTEGFTQMVITPGDVSYGGPGDFRVDVKELIEKGSLEFKVGKKIIQEFPLQGPNIFHLENHSKGASNVFYTNDPVKLQEAHDHEMKLCQPFFDEHKKWIESPEGKAIADAYWRKHPEGRAR